MILVTGGTGLVGAHLLFRLAQGKESVRAIFRDAASLERVRHVFSYYGDAPEALMKKIHWVQADINDLLALENAFVQVTMVYHCAALISFDPRDYARLRKVNEEGTANIVNLCLATRVKKLCYVSSIATIGKPVDASPAVEDDFGPDRYPGVYALSKQAAEMEVWRGSQEGLPMVIVNPGLILGPGFWKGGSGKLFTVGAAGKRFAPPGGTGFIGVTDLIRIMEELMASDIHNERYITVAGNLSYREVLGMIAREFGKKGPAYTIPVGLLGVLRWLDWLRAIFSGHERVLTRSTAASLRQPTSYSNQKIRETLGYHFEPLEETIAFCCRQLKADLDS